MFKETVRRNLIVLLILVSSSLAIGQTERIRIVAANITSGNYQSYVAPGERILDGLAPDIVLIQEFTIGSSASQTTADTNAFVERVFGSGYYWMREPGNEQIPNGVISRWPIIDSGQWEDDEVSNRDFAWARIDLPGDRDLWAVSVHLLTSGSGVRNTEAGDLVAAMRGASIPEDDYVAIGGDFNTGSRSESAVNTFRSYLGVSSSQEPTPADQNGNSNTNANRNEPYDWVLVDDTLHAYFTSTVIGSSTYPEGLVFDTRVYTPLSEVSPAQSGDSGASNMQHMAVVKDFLIPTVDADFTVSGETINFGTVNASEGPFQDSSIGIQVEEAFSMTGVSFNGAAADEFSLLLPDLSGGPVAILSDATMVFRWNPTANDGVDRLVTATISTDGVPSSFDIVLSGRPTEGNPGGSGEPIDVSGYRIEQDNSGATIVLPEGTEIPEGGFVVIGRDASQTAFESHWGVSLGEEVTYLNGMSIAGGNGFPVINGDEEYRLYDAQGSQIDPTSGSVPSGGFSEGNTHQRAATDGTSFPATSDSAATPGVFEGFPANTGNVVITEISDSSGSGNYIYEFIELYYDSFTPEPEPAGNEWIVR